MTPQHLNPYAHANDNSARHGLTVNFYRDAESFRISANIGRGYSPAFAAALNAVSRMGLVIQET